MKRLLFILSLLLTFQLSAQEVKKVLFLGNSYTYGNDLPKMIADIAESMGDSLIYDQNTPGGYQLWQHAQNATSLAKINADNWDYVVLQEQSYVGTIPWARDNFSYPSIIGLRDEVLKNDSCSNVMMYMTWGRKNAFQGFVTDGSGTQHFTPAFQDYFQMQDSLETFYMNIANQENLPVSPVGIIWKKMRTHFPTYDLYVGDGSHPNASGTYVAACSFYASIFEKSPVSSSFLPPNVDPAMADFIKAFTDTVVVQDFDQWHIDTSTVHALFTADTNGLDVQFTNLSSNAIQYVWEFGDGNTSTDSLPNHTYANADTFEVSLTAYGKCDTAWYTLEVVVKEPSTNPTSVQNLNSTTEITVYPQPANNTLNLTNISTSSRYNIYALSGQEVDRGTVSTNQSKIDVSQLNEGLYILKLHQNGKNSQHLKFIKKD